MDLNQISQRVDWLDDERRAGRVELSRLLQRLDTRLAGFLDKGE